MDIKAIAEQFGPVIEHQVKPVVVSALLRGAVLLLNQAIRGLEKEIQKVESEKRVVKL